MLKRILAILIAVLMIFSIIGCDDNVVYEDLSDYEDSAQSETEEPLLPSNINPLTGVAEFDDTEKANQRPIAIMVENSSISMPVQTGISKADVIYETEVEGGITRLMAVFQDISGIDKIGNVRSARYPYVDLALGHNAIYIHCGQDPTYCAPHLKDIDDLSIDTKSKGAQRISNGLKSEHTLYAIPNDLLENIKENFDIKVAKNAPWANFTDTTLSLDGGSATSVSVPFPASTTKFTYDANSGLYTRLIGSNAQTDYFTKETTQVKNVFVLLTNISNYPDGVHRKVDLTKGDGYYITNGTMQFIKWEKGAATNGFKFTDTDGNEIMVSAGNSWICIANKSTCKPTIE